jgi:ABC-2 type transport system permease protein
MGGLTAVFFQFLFLWQALPAFFVAVIVSPSLIAADLSNHALSLYLSRPIDRRDYVLGKMAVLALLLSPITWVGGLLIFVLQAYLEGDHWGLDNWRIGFAYVIGHITWIVVIALLTLAISAWVRFKPAARGALFGIIFILSGFAQAINAVTGTSVGDLIHLTRAIYNVVMNIFGGPTHGELPIALNWFTLVATCVISIWMLHRKLRAHEVVT